MALPLRDISIRQQFVQSNDTGQRRAQFVANIGHEFTFGGIGPLGRFFGIPQFLFGPFAFGNVANEDRPVLLPFDIERVCGDFGFEPIVVAAPQTGFNSFTGGSFEDLANGCLALITNPRRTVIAGSSAWFFHCGVHDRSQQRMRFNLSASVTQNFFGCWITFEDSAFIIHDEHCIQSGVNQRMCQ